MNERLSVKEMEITIAVMAERTGEHLYLIEWAPGDGWTRYRLAMRTSRGGEREISKYLNASEMSVYLSGMEDAADLLKPEK